MCNKQEVPSLEITNENTRKLLGKVHNLLLAHKYDYFLSKVLKEAQTAWPEIEGFYQALGANEVDLNVRPKALEVIDNLLRLNEAHVRDALYLGYMIGGAQTTYRSSNLRLIEQQALQIINQLRMTELMEANLSYGYVLTEKATQALKALVA